MSVASAVTHGASALQLPATRRLVVTWQHPVERSISPVGVLTYDGDRYGFHYIQNVRNVPGFRPFLGFPDLGETYESDQLFSLFAQRAMTPRRPDYTRWVSRLGLEDDATPWEQIARSGGRREGDTIQLFPVPGIQDGVLTCSFLVHGVRHIPERAVTVNNRSRLIARAELEQQLLQLRPGDSLELADEPDNPFNPRAVLTTTEAHFPLGWVPNLLLDDLHRIPGRDSVSLRVQQVNGPEAGWHLRLLVELRAHVPEDFTVFQGENWAPFSRPND